MQLSFQPLDAAGKFALAFSCAALLTIAFAAKAHSQPASYASNWAAGSKSSMRLIAANIGPAQGFYSAGAEIRLDPGAITYWRTPGEAGAPPVFAFEGSENIANVTVVYPTPTRIDESGTQVYGYREEVIFPLHVTPKDAALPALLALTVKYSVCGRICLPVKAEARLALPPLAGTTPGGVSGGQDAAIAMAEAKAPVRLAAEQRDARIAITRDRDAHAPTWRLTLRRGPEAHGGRSRQDGETQDQIVEDLFAEAPEGWYFETRASDRPNEFEIIEVERPKMRTGAPPPVILTLRQPHRSYEFSVDLDAASAFP